MSSEAHHPFNINNECVQSQAELQGGVRGGDQQTDQHGVLRQLCLPLHGQYCAAGVVMTRQKHGLGIGKYTQIFSGILLQS